MFWKGKEIRTIGELLCGISSCQTKDEADEFTRLYQSENADAIKNIGYVIGYASDEERSRLYELFGNNHPIFGWC